MSAPVNDDKRQRAIRSFVLRQGRLTKGQERAFELSWPTLGIDYAAKPLDWSVVFGNENPVHIEIGFGNGESLAEMARQNPDRNYLGIEVHGPGVGHLLMRLEAFECTNVRVCQHDAIEVLRDMVPDHSLRGLYLFFPDPWHKKKHHKRRIVQRSFLELLHNKLAADGFFHAATDWEPYAEHMLEVLNESADLFSNTATNDFVERPEERPLTKFEQRGIRLGHGVWDLIFKRN